MTPSPAPHGLQLKDLEGAGASFRALPDGSLQAVVERLFVRNARLQLPIGLAVAAHTTLRDAVIRVGAAPSFELLGVRAGELQLEGVEIAPGHRPGGFAPGGWRFDAIEALDGGLRVFIRDAAWVVDAD